MPFPCRFQRGSLSFEPRQKKGTKENRAAQTPRGSPPAKTSGWTHLGTAPCRSCWLNLTDCACADRGRVFRLAAGHAPQSAIGLRHGAPAKDRLVAPPGSGAPLVVLPRLAEWRLCLTRELPTPPPAPSHCFPPPRLRSPVRLHRPCTVSPRPSLAVAALPIG